MKRHHVALTLFVFATALFLAAPTVAAESAGHAEKSPVTCEVPVSSCSTDGETQALWSTSVLQQATEVHRHHIIGASAEACLQSCECCETASDCDPLSGFTAVCNHDIGCSHGGAGSGGCTYC